MGILRNLFLAASVAALVGGCTMAPKYAQPEAPVSSAWPTGPAYAARQAEQDRKAADLGWREFYSDPRLIRLLDLAVTNNRDLRIAMLNVELAQAQYRVQRSDLYPTLNATAGGTRRRIPGDLNGTGRAVTTTDYSVGAGVSAWELDLFGRVRSLKNQALNRYLATEQAQRAVYIALVSQVAVQYLTERELEEELRISQETLNAVESSYNLNRLSFESGVISELDLRTAEAQVETAKSDMTFFSRVRAQAENALVLLIGQPLPADLPPPRPLVQQDLVSNLPEGLPSDLLTRRPDILQAEFELKAANANIGAARAAFFPRILLTGAAGKASAKLEDLFNGPQTAWNFGPQITLPIFDGGNNKANLDIAKISKRVEIANYERAIQVAFREVADGLAARTMLEQQIQSQERLVTAEQRRFQLAEMRYRDGVDSYLNVLSAQQDLYRSQLALAQARATRLTNLAVLYKALGGGWTEFQPGTEPASAKK